MIFVSIPRHHIRSWQATTHTVDVGHAIQRFPNTSVEQNLWTIEICLTVNFNVFKLIKECIRLERLVIKKKEKKIHIKVNLNQNN